MRLRPEDKLGLALFADTSELVEDLGIVAEP